MSRNFLTPIVLPVGTTSAAPLNLQSGTNLSTPTNGAVEYDGTAFYTTASATSGRALSPSTLIYRLNANLTGNTGTTAQNALGASITVPDSTVYLFDFVLLFSKTAGTTSHNFTFAPGGTATINNAGWHERTSNSANSSGTLFSYASTTWTRSLAWNGITTASLQLIFNAQGTVSVNASGTLNLNYTLSANPGGAYSTLAGSYFMLTPIGASGAASSVGAWA